ncbi:hypothetical protein OK016_06720 [Vibrio chagasii]|nr:hypothetical protein [Vibrio chagasii]
MPPNIANPALTLPSQARRLADDFETVTITRSSVKKRWKTGHDLLPSGVGTKNHGIVYAIMEYCGAPGF